jgi:hypothetical protein
MTARSLMGNISILIDESGTFTEYDHKDPYYIVTLIFHDQQNDISKHIETLKGNLSQFTSADKAIHTGPVIHLTTSFLSRSVRKSAPQKNGEMRVEEKFSQPIEFRFAILL